MEGHSHKPSPDPQNTCKLIGQTLIPPPALLCGYKAGPLLHGQDKKNTLLLLNARFEVLQILLSDTE